MYGTDAIKELIGFAILSTNKLLHIDANGNGKVSFPETLSVITTLGFKFPAIYESFPNVKLEFKDLTDAELADLVTYFNETFDLDLPTDKLENMIKRTVLMLEYNYRYYRDMKEFAANKAA